MMDGDAIEPGAAKSVSIRDVHKSFGPVQVVKGLNIDISPGEFLVLLGPSGCGKTTALRMVAGLETVNAGQIRIGDEDVTGILPKYRDVAMVFQSYALYPHKTVAENIDFPLKVRGVSKGDRDSLVRDAAAQVHLEHYLDRYPRQLSGGQRQRVALARAIVRRPSVFLMDEPLSNLDAKLRGYMRAELKHMQHALGVTTIYVTHDQIEAMTLAHRVAIMEGGVIQQIDPPRRIYESPANMFVAGFIGSPPMNFIHGELQGKKFSAPGVSMPFPTAAAARNAVLGFRPEDARVVEPGSGLLDARVFTAELTGDMTLVTLSVGQEDTVVAKMPRDFMCDYDANVGVDVDRDRIFLFDGDGGERLDTAVAAGGSTPALAND